MDPNAARQSPQQRKFHDHRSKIMMMFRDQKAIDEHNDKISITHLQHHCFHHRHQNCYSSQPFAVIIITAIFSSIVTAAAEAESS
jgi:hypothetical protein